MHVISIEVCIISNYDHNRVLRNSIIVKLLKSTFEKYFYILDNVIGVLV